MTIINYPEVLENSLYSLKKASVSVKYKILNNNDGSTTVIMKFLPGPPRPHEKPSYPPRSSPSSPTHCVKNEHTTRRSNQNKPVHETIVCEPPLVCDDTRSGNSLTSVRVPPLTQAQSLHPTTSTPKSTDSAVCCDTPIQLSDTELKHTSQSDTTQPTELPSVFDRSVSALAETTPVSGHISHTAGATSNDESQGETSSEPSRSPPTPETTSAPQTTNLFRYPSDHATAVQRAKTLSSQEKKFLHDSTRNLTFSRVTRETVLVGETDDFLIKYFPNTKTIGPVSFLPEDGEDFVDQDDREHYHQFKKMQNCKIKESPFYEPLMKAKSDVMTLFRDNSQ